VFIDIRRPISRALMKRSTRNFHHRVAWFETKKTIRRAFSGDAYNVRAIDKTEMRRFCVNSFPSHFSTEMLKFRPRGSRATPYNQKPLRFKKFKSSQFYWKLKYESRGIGENLCPRRMVGSRRVQSEKRRKWPLWQRIFKKLPEMKTILSLRCSSFA
jgi:hypothetical protein